MTIELGTDIKSAKGVKQSSPKRSRVSRTKPAVITSSQIVLTNSGHASDGYDSQARYALIAEAAYHLAEQRGFRPGHELDDWLAAEREVDARLYGETHAF